MLWGFQKGSYKISSKYAAYWRHFGFQMSILIRRAICRSAEARQIIKIVLIYIISKYMLFTIIKKALNFFAYYIVNKWNNSMSNIVVTGWLWLKGIPCPLMTWHRGRYRWRLGTNYIFISPHNNTGHQH